MNNSQIFTTASQAVDRGWNIIPIKCYIPQDGKEKKAPPYKFEWKQYITTRVKKLDLLNWNKAKHFRDQNAYGYAVLCGELSNLFVVDTDTDEATIIIQDLIKDTRTFVVATPRGGKHFYFRHVNGFENYVGFGVSGIDIRTQGGYVVGAGSKSCAGKTYAVMDNSEVAVMPPELMEYLVQNKKDRANGKGKKGKKKKDDWFSRIQENGWQDGERVEMLKKTVGMLIRQGMNADTIQVICRTINDKSEVPLREGELESQMRSLINRFIDTHDDDIAAFSDLKDEIFNMNTEYAQITIGGKPMVMRFDKEDEEEYEFIQPAAMRTETKHMIKFVKGKKKSVYDIWAESAYRRRYKGIIFEPSEEAQHGFKDEDNGAYNLWRGLKFEPKEGDWSLFRNHLTEIMAPGHGDYVLMWIARMFQDPGGERPGKVLVFRGRTGTGKSFARRIIGEFFGLHYYKTDDIQHLIGRFNTVVANTVFLALEEAMWAGDKSQVGKLKERITSRTQSIEKKGIDIITVASHLNIWMNSNEDWVVPAQDNDRRFVMFDVDPKHAEDYDYFEKIQKQMDNGGYEAMLYDMLKTEVCLKKLKDSPKTIALSDQMDRMNDPIKQFARECLELGQLHSMHKGGWKHVILVEKLEESYNIWCNEKNIHHKGFNFRKDIVKYLAVKRTRLRFGKATRGSGRYPLAVFGIGSLKGARDRFDNGMPRDWEDPIIPQTYNEEEIKKDYIEGYSIYKDEYPF